VIINFADLPATSPVLELDEEQRRRLILLLNVTARTVAMCELGHYTRYTSDALSDLHELMRETPDQIQRYQDAHDLLVRYDALGRPPAEVLGLQRADQATLPDADDVEKMTEELAALEAALAPAVLAPVWGPWLIHNTETCPLHGEEQCTTRPSEGPYYDGGKARRAGNWFWKQTSQIRAFRRRLDVVDYFRGVDGQLLVPCE
jgi:hypothetical protein